jgi:hypothetical protein
LLSGDDYLIEEFCEQGEFENSIWPYSVNTIRIITLRESDKIVAVAALQRLGVDKEKCVDNACAGGLYSMIDLESGRLSAARSHSKDKLLDNDGMPLLFDEHPVTGAQIKGRTIPNWKKLQDDIIHLHQQLLFTEIDFIAWDIALTDNGYKIIEANTSCGMHFLQNFGGVRNGKVGQWMKDKGYIK